MTSIDRNNILFNIVDEMKDSNGIFLDNNNLIIITNNTKNNISEMIMIHYKLVDDKIVKAKEWNIKEYNQDLIHNFTVIQDYYLVYIKSKRTSMLYNYKDEYIIFKNDIWDNVELGKDNEIFNKYNGILASFTVNSDIEEDDIYTYTNKITNEKVTTTFEVTEGTYYGILNLDGTIRDNKLFKGDSFYNITKIIDLNKYESVDKFKEEIKNKCNLKKETKKEEYKYKISKNKNGSTSPYLDDEVYKVLLLEK